MSNDNVVSLAAAAEVSDPLTELLRSGAAADRGWRTGPPAARPGVYNSPHGQLGREVLRNSVKFSKTF